MTTHDTQHATRHDTGSSHPARTSRRAPLLRAGMLAAVGAGLGALAWIGPGAQGAYEHDDESWVSVTGSVVSVGGEEFAIDFGSGRVNVEMDDWAWYVDELPLEVGERVTVYGRIDDDLFEGREIEADSVYVFDRSTYFYALDGDPTITGYGYPIAAPAEGAWVNVTGRVTEVEGSTITVSTPGGDVKVETTGMAYDPLDDEGAQKLEEGDRVSVAGHLELGLFEERAIDAKSIVSMTRDTTKRRQAAGGTDDGESR